MIKNIKQWKTTTIGLVIIAAAIVSVFIKEIQWSDAMIGIAAGLTLVFSPDNIVEKIKGLVK